MQLNASVWIKPRYAGRVSHLMVAIHLASAHVRVVMLDPSSTQGTPVPLDQDHRLDEAPKVFLDGTALRAFESRFVVPVEVTTDRNGRFHFGVFAIGFDDQWETLEGPFGELGQVYESVAVSGVGHPRGFLSPPFAGEGNAIPTLGWGWFVAATTLGVVLGRRRNLVDR